MKFYLTTAIFLALFLSPFGFANSVEANSVFGPVAGSEIVKTDAVSNGSGVLIRWKLSDGKNIVGFNIYRATDKDFVRVNKVVVPGGYISTAAAEESDFSFFDREGTIGDSYRIEVIEVGKNNLFTDSVESEYDSALDLSSIYNASGAIGHSAPTLVEKYSPASEKETTANNNLAGDFTTQQWVAAQPGVRIRTSAFGLFRVSRTDLQNAGFDVNASPTLWQLYFEGRQQAINVAPNGSYIEFFGSGIDLAETSQNTYFLVVGPSPGRRIGTRLIRKIRPPVTSQNFEENYSRKLKYIYAGSILNGAEENYFGEVISTTPSTAVFDLKGLDSAAGGTAEVSIETRGLTLAAHSSRMILNGVELDPIPGANRAASFKTYQIPVAQLQETGNTLQVSAVTPGDISFLVRTSVKYKRVFTATAAKLQFTTPDYHQLSVRGFTGRSIRLYDISDPDKAIEISNADVSPTGVGSEWKVTIGANRGRRMFALEDAGLMQVDSVTANTPSTLGAAVNAANYIIITHPNWMTEANTWAAYRAGQGFQTKVIDVNDVFDEFGFGNFGAMGIRAFLQHAKLNWQVPPRYVLMLGDASYDSRNYEGFGANNLVPTHLVDTLFEETGSDDSIADFDNDGLAEMAIGRIPARTPVAVSNAFQKVVDFESTIATAPGRGSLCASDIPQGYDFQALCLRLHDRLPASIPKVEINRADPDAKVALVNAMNAGKYLVNYSGHGSAEVWAHSTFFGINDVQGLVNNANLSVYTMLTCLNGYFVRPNNDSLSERLLSSTGGGGVAVWSSSGSTTADVQEIMATRFFTQVGTGTTMVRLGDLVNDAKTTLDFGRDVRLSWVLLGDPGLRVKVLPAAKSE